MTARSNCESRGVRSENGVTSPAHRTGLQQGPWKCFGERICVQPCKFQWHQQRDNSTLQRKASLRKSSNRVPQVLRSGFVELGLSSSLLQRRRPFDQKHLQANIARGRGNTLRTSCGHQVCVVGAWCPSQVSQQLDRSVSFLRRLRFHKDFRRNFLLTCSTQPRTMSPGQVGRTLWVALAYP